MPLWFDRRHHLRAAERRQWWLWSLRRGCMGQQLPLLSTRLMLPRVLLRKSSYLLPIHSPNERIKKKLVSVMASAVLENIANHTDDGKWYCEVS